MINSYTAAGTMPWKLLQHKGAIVDGSIKPIHLQLIPTNKCNRNCTWCSCSAVDRTLELPITEIRAIFEEFSSLGTEAVTISGGGEPTVHKDFLSILIAAARLNIRCGLVTNGLNFINNKLDMSIINNALTWLRISVFDTENIYDIRMIEEICGMLPNVDIGISFTVTTKSDMDIARQVCEVAAIIPNITHIRFVQDIFNATEEYNIEAMDTIKKICKIITHKAIFQYRNIFTLGHEQCLISLLKPTIGADGYIYPCCGVQYASTELRKLPEDFRMGTWREFKHTNSFDGRKCSRCYYDDYNRTLNNLICPLKHKEFI